MDKNDNKHDLVKKAYGDIARERTSCCGPQTTCCDPQSACCGWPAAEGEHPLPDADLGLSCGDPVSFLQLKPGDAVLDLGCGAGRDVFPAARIVGEAGRVIGVDMTPEMLSLARSNAERFQSDTGLNNTEFREGHIEDLPVGDGEIDVVISNCVINLSPDKRKVFLEIYRALKPAGKMVISDIVLHQQLPESLKNNETLYAACIAGASLREDYLQAIQDAGFLSIEVLSEKPYSFPASDFGADAGDGREMTISSITLKATK